MTMLSPSSLLLLLVIVVILALIQYHDDDRQSVHVGDHQQWDRQLQSGVNPFTTKTHSPAPPPSVLQGDLYQHQILTQRYVRQPNNSTDDNSKMAAPTDDNSNSRSIALNGIVLSVSGFFIFMVIVAFIISRIKSKALQVDEDKKNEDEMAEIGLRMVSVGTQWDDHVIPLLPVAYSNTTGFQITTGMATNSTLKMDSKLPPIRKKLKVRKSADGSIRSAVEIKANMSQFGSSSKGGIVSNNNNNNNNSIGTMVVSLHRGYDIRSGNTLFGKADTYAIIRIGNIVKKSKVSVDGGKNPEWNEEFTFEVFNDKDDIEIDLFDKETVGEDRFQAHVKTTMEKWIKYGGFEGELGVTDRSNKAEGKISISATFTKV